MWKVIVCDILIRYWLLGKVELDIVTIKITYILVFYLLQYKKMYNNGYLFYDKSIQCSLSKARQMHNMCPLCLENCVLHLRGYIVYLVFMYITSFLVDGKVFASRVADGNI